MTSKAASTLARRRWAAVSPSDRSAYASVNGKRSWDAKTPQEKAEHLRKMQAGRKKGIDKRTSKG